MNELTTVGRAEKIDFPDLDMKKVPSKVDTGADTSSIWAEVTEQSNSSIQVVFFGSGSTFYTGETYVFKKNEYTVTRVANSFGSREVRYKIKLRVKLKGRTVRTSFSLSDRSKKLYPILIGRSLLSNKFLVDVSRGSPLREAEKNRAERLVEDMKRYERTRV